LEKGLKKQHFKFLPGGQYTMNQEINSILYAALCSCFGLSPNSSQASRRIREAYQEPENAPCPP
jgi:hypothetical protein